MNDGNRKKLLFIIVMVFCSAAIHLFVSQAAAGGEPVKPVLSSEEKLRLGEQMYRQGILPSGEPMMALVKGDLPVQGTAFTCASCHQRSGLGSVEGEVFTPPTNGPNLFAPFKIRYTKFGMKNGLYFPVPIDRPAYTDETLAHVLWSGIDSAGKTIDDIMPRYELSKDDMEIMIFYLKSLSSKISPGVSDTNLRFATVITDDVSQDERNGLLQPLLNFIQQRNNYSAYLRKLAAGGKIRMVGNVQAPPSLEISLSIWQLHGPAETWRSQLEEYYGKEQVFALIGGISKGEWKPIHQFSEDHHIPCLFPNTDFPVISRTDWYTLYLSKGYYQEGEAAARYLSARKEIANGGPIVQIVRDSREARALSTGFQETWQELGHGASVTIMLKAGEELTKGAVEQMLAKKKPAAVVLWDGSATLVELEVLGGVKNRAPMVIVSSSYLGKSLWSLKDEVRDFTYITYPFRLRDARDRQNSNIVLSINTTKEANQAYAVKEILTTALINMRDNYYRDNFMDVIGMIEDLEVPLYDRLSFGPGQRYASKGCYIVQLSRGEKPELVQRSDWVIH